MELKNSTLDDVAAVIGFSATLRLAAWFGDGSNIYVPEKISEGQVLANLIGLTAARRLCDEWGGQHLALPRLRAYEDDVKRRIIARMLEHNFSTREVATHMRMTERRIQQIARELEAAGLIDVIAPKRKKPVEAMPAKTGGIWGGIWDGLGS
jgi:hypothetical protein